MAESRSSLKVSLFSEPPKAPAGIFVLFGATGDLTARKIAPALYNLRREGLLGDDVAVVGVARRPLSDDAFREEMLSAIRRHSRSQPVDESLWRDFASRWHYQVVHADRPDEYEALAERLKAVGRCCGKGCGALFYLASTPETWPAIAAGLARVGLNRPLTPRGFCRVIVEKPLGHDLASSQRLNAELLAAFKERQVFRIDHYLGKETVQNILVLRFANSVFEPLLNRRYVDNVQITTAETVGMEGRRGAYYETAGALRDMIQSHMLQLLALVAMGAPRSMDADGVRIAKARLLKSIRPMSQEDMIQWTVRGQYLGDGEKPSYRQEAGVAADSSVETYAAVRLFIDNRRWSGVPFYLRTGKRMAAKASYVAVEFKRRLPDLFHDTECDLAGPNRLLMQIYPDEGAFLSANAKLPGARMLLRPVRLGFEYRCAFESASPEAYERLLLDAFVGEAVLFIRHDEVEASWRFVDTVRRIWDNAGGPELAFYPCGSWGPQQAELIFGDPYKRWYNLDPR
ncbi:MAG TPA: glucose-6-phosphate dehydrogenase [Phycisphaerae bacterium]|nr:glucose-6-phosphate dehydrogenase [Phycisphaerae bacterium]